MFPSIKEVVYRVNELGGAIVPLRKPGGKDRDNGKRPIIPEWNTSPLCTPEEVEKALNKYRGHNFGLVLGAVSNMIAIDIDGQGGERILEEWCQGDLPDTVEYTTPSGGRRLIYAIPEAYKGCRFEKDYERVKDVDHEECALLGDDTMTVLPLCKNGYNQRYEFVQGKDFDSIDIADAPMWMIQRMTTKVAPKVQSSDDSKEISNLKDVFSHCSNILNSIEVQCNEGLDEESWYNRITLMVTCRLDDEAKAFSALSSKHDDRSIERINMLIKSREAAHTKPTRCVTLGCSEDMISQCHNRVFSEGETVKCSPISLLSDLQTQNLQKVTREELLSNHTAIVDAAIEKMLGDDTNAYLQEEVLDSLVYLDEHEAYEFTTRAEKIRKLGSVSKDDFEKRIKSHRKKINEASAQKIKHSLNRKKKIGFRYDTKGALVSINANVFSRHILTRHKLVLGNGENVYMYKGNFFQYMTEYDLMKFTRDEFHLYEPDKWNRSYHDAILLALKLDMPTASTLKKPVNILNFKNGLLNMETKTFFDHTSEYFTTSQLKVEFDENADCPLFRETLSSMMLGDIELIRLVQEIMGYCISYEVKAEKVFIFTGEGANGKSLLAKTIIELCGKENTSTLSMSDLEKPFERFQLVNKLLNVSTENELGSKGLNSEPLKIISSGERITVEEKFKMSFSYEPYVKLLFAANRLPFSKDKSFGLARRLIIVPFKMQYVTNPKGVNQSKMDVYLFDKLMDELSGILNFAIAGFQRLKDNDFQFTKSKVSDEILHEYKVEINPILDFYIDKVRSGSNESRISKKDLYNKYIDWCEENNYKTQMNIGQHKFTRELKSIFITENVEYKEQKSNGTSYFIGISVKN